MNSSSSVMTQPLPNTGTQIRFQRNPSQAARQISLITTILIALVAVVFMGYAFTEASANYSTLASLFIISLVCVLLTTTSYFEKFSHRMVTLVIVIQVTLLLASLYVSGMGVFAALIILIYTTIVAAATLEGRQAELITSLGVFVAMATALLNVFSPINQVNLPAVQIYLPSLLGIMVMVYIVLLSTEYIAVTMRIKLLTALLTIVLVPLIIQSFISTQFTQTSTVNQTNQALKLAATSTASKVDEFLSSNRDAVAQDATLAAFSNYLNKPSDKRRGSQEEAQLFLTVAALGKRQQQEYLSSYGLLDVWGMDVYDTNVNEVGTFEADADYFKIPLTTGQVYISSVQFSMTNGDPFIYFSAPVRDTNQKVVGVLRVRYDALILQRIIEKDTGALGARSYPILLDENLIRLGDTITPNFLYRAVGQLSSSTIINLNATNRLPKVEKSLYSTNMTPLALAIQNFQSKPFFTAEFHTMDPNHTEAGTAVTLSNKPWLMLFVQDQSSLKNLLAQQGRVSTLVATLIAGLVSVISTLLAAVLTRPINTLTSAAEKISTGDLSAHANVESNDEFGELAVTFNSMTSQLRTFVNELEDRVRARTEELARQNEFLQFRSRQLETVSEVARSVTVASELESLLTRVTQLISDRFGFYHVGIFLVDDQAEYAVLRAANSEGGQRMLARRHKLLVGQVGIIGYVTGKGEPRIATDVGKDAVFFNNPDLPRTRSEMGLPLRIGTEVIGALDVQSEVSDAFSQEDVELFAILADQIAIAISNNRLLAETAKALEEMQKVHQQYLKQEWSREVQETQHSSFRFTQQGLVMEPLNVSSEAESVIRNGKPFVRKAATDKNGVLIPAMIIVPVLVRGEVIGVIRLNESTNRDFSLEEVETASLVADQVGLALENARLFEQTLRRAERERKVLEITSRIRSVNDPETMLQIAVDELQRTLNASRAQIVIETTDISTHDQPSADANSAKNDNNGHNGHNGNGHHSAG